MAEWKRSVCPYDCPDTCGLLVRLDQGKAVEVKGDPAHTMTRGSLCAKMMHYERTVYSQRRLTQPQIRSGPKGSGQFRPVSWEEAVRQIGTRWREIITAHGPEAILPYSYAGTMGLLQRNAGHPFFHKLGASLLDRGICTPAKGAGWEAVMGATPAPHPDRVLDSDLVILWSSDAAATNIHLLHKVKQARQRGAKVLMIDLYHTPTAAAADEVYLLKPGSDAALALGIMHLLVRDARHDPAFIRANVAGFDELASQVLPNYPPERVARLTGLTSRQVEQLAEVFGNARAPFISLGGGLSRYTNGAMTTRCIVALPALTGAWARGGGCFCGTSTGAAFPMEKLTRPELLTGSPRSISMNQLGNALTRLEDPPLKSLYVYHANPAAVAPDQNRVLAGLAREDLFTVVHERFMTDTARYADILLPATSSLEHSDIYRAYGSYSVQRAEGLIPPLGESRSNRAVFTLLAREMGFNEEIFFQSEAELIAELISSPNSWWNGVNLEAFTAGEPVELCPPQLGWQTATGKIMLHDPGLDDPLLTYRPPHSDDYPLQLVTAPALKTLNSTFFEREDLRAERMEVSVHPSEADRRQLNPGERVILYNDLGEVWFYLKLDPAIPCGLALAEGVWWMEFAPGERTVNSLCSQRLTDQGRGSTFYDNRVELRSAD